MKYNSTGPTYSCESCVGPAFHLTTTATAKRCKLLANCTLMGTATTCSDCDDGYTLTTIGTCV